MTKQEVIERFCAISSKVRDHLSTGDGSFAADCFCGYNRVVEGNPFLSGPPESYFAYDEEVMKFIEETIAAKLSSP